MMTAKEKIEIAIEVLNKYKLNGGEAIVESLSLILLGLKEVSTSSTEKEKTYFHLELRDKEGNVISTSNNHKTFLSAITTAGLREVYKLGLSHGTRPFLTEKPAKESTNKYVAVDEGLYMYKVGSAKSMKPLLDKISEALGLGWTVSLT